MARRIPENSHSEGARNPLGAVLQALRRLLASVIAIAMITAFCVSTLAAGAMALSASFFSLVSGAIESVYDGGTVRRTQVAAIESQRAEHQKKVAELDFRLDESEQKLKRQSAELNIKLEETERKLNLQSAELDKLKADQLVTFKGKNLSLKQAVSETSSTVSTIAKKGALRNLASMPAEGIPLVGIAVVVAATTLEVSDACAITESMHDLDVALNPENRVVGRPEVCGLEVPTRAVVWEQVKNSPGAVWNIATDQYNELPTWSEAGETIWEFPGKLSDFGSSIWSGWEYFIESE